MAKKVQFVTGLLSGVIFPAITWFVFDVLFKNWVVFNKPAIPYLISVCINLFILRYFIKNNKEAVGYGMLVSTFVIMMAIFKLKL